MVSVKEMQGIEAAADSNGISYDMMFERVSIAVAGHILRVIEDVEEPRVAILVGSGNNGGDGLVTAVRLAEHSHVQVGVYLVKAPSEGDEKLQAVRDAGIFVAEAENDQQYRVLRNMVASATVVVDAIFGIGVRLPLEGEITKILRNIHQALDAATLPPPEGTLLNPTHPTPQRPTRRVIALDCPGGVDCDTGEVDKMTIPADETITFIAVKQGMLAAPAAEYVGDLLIADLGIPTDLDELKAISTTYITDVREMLPQRPDVSHKGTFGKAMVVAGSVNYTGAAGLAAMSAYRAGAGLVTVAAPMPVVAALASSMLEPTWVLVPHDMGVISEKAADVISEEMDVYSAMLIGPGIGTEDTTKDMLLKLFKEREPDKAPPVRSIGFAGVQQVEKKKKDTDEAHDASLPPLVLDADALNLMATIENWWTYLPANTILTPHPGEMARLCDIEREEIAANRISLAQEKAAQWNCIVLLKGAHTVIAAPNGQTAILPFKSSALATAGSGDVLAGIIVSLLAQGAEPFAAAVAGGYLHGTAGTLAKENAGTARAVVAGDMITLPGHAIPPCVSQWLRQLRPKE
ncbi:MAG: NAD(P)H-hydrate dehydratase [Chloroflexota bacterium]